MPEQTDPTGALLNAIRELAKERTIRFKLLHGTGERIRVELDGLVYMIFVPASSAELTPGRIAARLKKWPRVGTRMVTGYVVLSRYADVSSSVLGDGGASLPPRVAIVALWTTKDRLVASQIDENIALILEAAGIRRPELRRMLRNQLETQADDQPRDIAPAASVRPSTAQRSHPWHRGPTRGMTLDAYRLDHRLGRGHSAEVWRATVIHDIPGVTVSAGDTVAVKVYLPPLLHGFESLRIQREFAIAAELDHPNLAKVYDLVISPSRPLHAFMAMEYVDGPTLKSHIESTGRLDTSSTIELGRQLFAALAELHSLGAVHRDVKAANVMVSNHGSSNLAIKLVDLGIVSVTADDPMTVGSVFLGSKHSAPLEQLTGQGLDERTDIYGAGSVLFHCLKGVPMYYGVGPEGAIVQRMLQQPEHLESSGSPTDRRLADFINSCIAINRTARPQTALDCIDILADLAGVSVTLGPRAASSRSVVANVAAGKQPPRRPRK